MRKSMLCIILTAMVLLQPLSIKANEPRTILIASKQLPYLLHVLVKDDQHMQVRFISRDMILPTTCSAKPQPLKKIDLKTDFSCAKQSVEKFFHFKSQNYVYIHLNRIAKDIKLPYDSLDFQKLSNLTDYFSSVVDRLDITMLLNYQRYIESDMHLSDYYDFYHMFKGKKVEISYYYVNQLYSGRYTLPMDKRFRRWK